MEKVGITYYLLYLCKYLAVSFIFFRLGKKFGASNPFWQYLIPMWNYMILCRCAYVSKYYAIGYYIIYFIAAALQIFALYFNDTGLNNIWLSLFVLSIFLEIEIFGKLAVRLQKNYWLYGFSGFLAYFPLIFLILSKNKPSEPLNRAAISDGDYPVY